jgi:N-succinyldiaminopimelate aminotransferase
MNPLLSHLQPYPFERLRQLFANLTPNPALRPISLGMGEPKHATPAFIQQAMIDAIASTPSGLASYPATAGEPQLREAFTFWLKRRYGLAVDPATQVLPVNGSREALFALAQTVINPAPGTGTGAGDDADARPLVVCPNPFYQIYEGAALLAGAQPYFVPSDPARNFAQDWDSVPASVWARTRLLFVCSPGNPTGAVMPLIEWKKLFELSDRHGFVIASDECYSEIYFHDEQPPLGGMQAAARLGRSDFKNLVSFTSLSKRSNVPGMRSGFCAGDAAIMQQFLLYRTYHGSAMSPVVQAASIAAWRDEQHVVENRALYRSKFAQVTPLLAEVLDVALPDAGFYLWANVEGNDTDFARDLFTLYNVTVLPGSYLARDSHGTNPGARRIRMALVAEPAECVEAAQRIVQFVKSRT